MEILVIHGSPHNGNTLKLTRKFEEVVKKYNDVLFEYLSINELNIQMCRGCFNCITKGEDLCPLKDDDVKLVLEEMDKANGTIFSAPTYMYNIPALMKNLIDRLAYLGHRPRYLNKYAVVISTTCEKGLEEALRYLSFGTVWAWGFQLVGTLGAYTHPFFLDKKRKLNLDKKLTDLAKKFHTAITSTELPAVTFEEMIRFRAMSLHSLYSKEIFSADYRFYHQNNEIGKNYFIQPVKINFFINVISRILSFFIGRSMRNCRKNSDLEQKFLE